MTPELIKCLAKLAVEIKGLIPTGHEVADTLLLQFVAQIRALIRGSSQDD